MLVSSSFYCLKNIISCIQYLQQIKVMRSILTVGCIRYRIIYCPWLTADGFLWVLVFCKSLFVCFRLAIVFLFLSIYGILWPCWYLQTVVVLEKSYRVFDWNQTHIFGAGHTPHKTLDELMCSGRDNNSCSTSSTRRITVKRHGHHLVWKSCLNTSMHNVMQFSSEQKLIYLLNPTTTAHVKIIGFYIIKSLELRTEVS
jgi:hypothetical protein